MWHTEREKDKNEINEAVKWRKEFKHYYTHSFEICTDLFFVISITSHPIKSNHIFIIERSLLTMALFVPFVIFYCIFCCTHADMGRWSILITARELKKMSHTYSDEMRGEMLSLSLQIIIPALVSWRRLNSSVTESE